MVEEIGHLVEDIRVEEAESARGGLRRAAGADQIWHFLYNTLDNIIWLAESKDTEQVVRMVSSLSSFFPDNLKQGAGVHHGKERAAHPGSY